MQNPIPAGALPHKGQKSQEIREGQKGQKGQEGYVVEVGGHFNAEFGSLTAALKAGLAIKNRDSKIQVKVYDARERA